MGYILYVVHDGVVTSSHHEYLYQVENSSISALAEEHPIALFTPGNSQWYTLVAMGRGQHGYVGIKQIDPRIRAYHLLTYEV